MPPKLPPIVAEALLEEIEESADIDAIAAQHGVNASKLRERLKRKLQGEIRSAPRVVEPVDIKASLTKGTSREPSERQEHGMAVMLVLDSMGVQHVETGMLYNGLARGGMDLHKESKYKSSTALAIMKGLASRGLIEIAEFDGKKVGIVTEKGREFSRQIRELVEKYRGALLVPR